MRCTFSLVRVTICNLTQGSIFFFFHDTATTEIYTLSLRDALPTCHRRGVRWPRGAGRPADARQDVHQPVGPHHAADRKSTRLNPSHGYISYAVFCLKKKKHPTACSDRVREAHGTRRRHVRVHA